MSNLLRRCFLISLSTGALLAGTLPFHASSSHSSQFQGTATAVDRGLQSYEQLLRTYLTKRAGNEKGNSKTSSTTPSLKTSAALNDDIDAVDISTQTDAAITKDAIPRDAYE